jgi:hypothetical protein
MSTTPPANLIDQVVDFTLKPNPFPTGVLRADGSTALTAGWNAGNFRIDSQNSSRWFNVRAYGAKGDWVQAANTGSINNGSGTLTMAGATFTASDVGKLITVSAAGVGGKTLCAAIAGFTSSTVVSVSPAASSTSLTGTVTYGTDDATAIATAIAAASIGAGKTGNMVYLPQGMYALGSGLTCAGNITIAGEGQFTSQLIPMANTAQDVLTVNYTNVAPSEFYGFGVYNNAGLSSAFLGTGIKINGCADFHLHNIWVTGMNVGIQLHRSAFGKLVHVTVEQNMSHGFYMNGTRETALTSCTSFNNHDNGIYLFNDGTQPQGNSIVGCHIVSNFKNGILMFAAAHNSIIGNNFVDNSSGAANTYDHIAVTGSGAGASSSYSNRFIGNVSGIEGGGTVTRYGLSLDANCYNNFFAGNDLWQNTATGVIQNLSPAVNNNVFMEGTMMVLTAGRVADITGAGTPGNTALALQRSVAGGVVQMVMRRSSDGADRGSIGFDDTNDRVRIGNATAAVLEIDQTAVPNMLVNGQAIGTSGQGVIALKNGVAPSTSPAGGGQLYVEAGALKWRGSGGTVTVLGVA